MIRKYRGVADTIERYQVNQSIAVEIPSCHQNNGGYRVVGEGRIERAISLSKIAIDKVAAAIVGIVGYGQIKKTVIVEITCTLTPVPEKPGA